MYQQKLLFFEMRTFQPRSGLISLTTGFTRGYIDQALSGLCGMHILH
jgi:hypothetical protein